MQIQYLQRVSTVKWEPRITQILRCAASLSYVLGMLGTGRRPARSVTRSMSWSLAFTQRMGKVVIVVATTASFSTVDQPLSAV
jgi:hypothetical protein